MGEEIDKLDLAVARIAARQHGVIAVAQLHELGIGRNGITRRIKRGHLHRLHRGVYAVGHRGLSWHGRWMAAVLACGDGAALSHGSAASLWGLLKPIDGPIHVSAPSTSGRTTRRGIHVHRCPSLTKPSSSPSYPPAEGGRGRRPSPTPVLTTYRDNVPLTTVPRTLEDLRRTSFVSPHLIRRAIRQAELKGLRLEGIETDRTRSDLETAFLALFARHRLPAPEVNPKLGRWEVDFLWRSQRLVVEADTWTYHRGSISFEDDHARDLDLRQQGFTVLRFTDRQLESEPERVVGDLTRVLDVARR